MDPESIETLTLGEEVETLPQNFMFGSKIKTLHIPASVTTLGNHAFLNCSDLESITVDSQNKHYDSRENCNAIIKKAGLTIGQLVVGCKNSTITSTVGFIGENAFYGSDLKSIDIPNTVTFIGYGAFRNCKSLTNATLPNTITSISSEMFHGCSSLTHVNIPNSVTSIGIYAFNGCTSLTNIDIPSTVTTIGMYAFANCKELTSITLPSTIDNIDERTFANCCNLTTITIPNTVTTIGIDAFNGCTGLTSIEIPNSVTTIGNGAFTACRNLINITLPNSLAAISKRMFSHCSALTSIDIPSTVTYIGEGAFKACSSLIDVIIPDSDPTIDAWAFCDCSSLESVTIPSSVTEVPIYTFAGCTALKRVTCLSTTPPDVDTDYSFDNSIYSTAVLRVPASAISAYQKAEGWNKFKVVEDMNETIRGDVNLDNEVNVSDINAVINCILSTDNDMPTADVNQDGEVNISDINSVIDIILHPASNDWSLQVLEIGGGVSSFALNDMPKMTCFSDSLIITTPKQRLSFELNNIQRITYSKVGGKSLTCSGLNGPSGLNTINHIIIHFKDEDYQTLYLENLNALSTSRKGGINGQYGLLVDSRDGQHYYAVNEIDSITFGSIDKIPPETYNPISVTHLKTKDIVQNLEQVDESLYVAEATRISDMMWEHGAGNYSVEQYQQLMDRLCNVMNSESTTEFDNYEYIGDYYDNDSYTAKICMIIWSNLLKHSHFYVCLRGDTYLSNYANDNPDKIFIASFGTNMVDWYPMMGWGYSSSGGYYSTIRESDKIENLLIFSKLSESGYPEDVHVQYEEDLQSIHGHYWMPLGNGTYDEIADSHITYTFGQGIGSYLNYGDHTPNTSFPIGLHRDALFSGRGILIKHTDGKTYGTWGSGCSPTASAYFNAVLASLCFQMKADVKNVDELLNMIRATTLTDTVQRYDIVQPLHLINPAGFFQQYLMPLSLPVTVGEGPYVQLEKGFYKGVIFDIPGAEVNIDGEWVSAIATNQDRIKSQDPFTLEWRLNVPKLISMGYSNNSNITGHVIVVDDQFAGLNLEKEFIVNIVQ